MYRAALTAFTQHSCSPAPSPDLSYLSTLRSLCLLGTNSPSSLQLPSKRHSPLPLIWLALPTSIALAESFVSGFFHLAPVVKGLPVCLGAHESHGAHRGSCFSHASFLWVPEMELRLSGRSDKEFYMLLHPSPCLLPLFCGE